MTTFGVMAQRWGEPSIIIGCLGTEVTLLITFSMQDLQATLKHSDMTYMIEQFGSVVISEHVTRGVHNAHASIIFLLRNAAESPTIAIYACCPATIVLPVKRYDKSLQMFEGSPRGACQLQFIRDQVTHPRPMSTADLPRIIHAPPSRIVSAHFQIASVKSTT